MSTTFIATRFDPDKNCQMPLWRCTCNDGCCELCLDHLVNVGYSYDAELLRWLDIPYEPDGTIKATELAARCRRRLWDEPRNHDPAIKGYDSKEPGRCHVYYGGRREGYLRMRTEQLLAIAEFAADNFVSWS